MKKTMDAQEETAVNEKQQAQENTAIMGQLVMAWPVLQKITNMPLPGVLALRLARFIRAVQAEIEIHDEIRNKLIVKHGEEVDGGGYQVDKPDAKNAFFAEYNPVLETAIDIPPFILSLDDVTHFDGVSARDIIAIEWMIENGEA